MFYKYNSLTNTLSPSDQLSAYIPQSFGTKEAANNFFVAPQPGSHHHPVAAAVHSDGNAAARKAHTVSSAAAHTGAASSAQAVKAHAAAAGAAAHGHHAHAAPWEGVNLWRTPFKGDTDTVTQVKSNKGTLDRYVENRVRQIQQLQIQALRNKSVPTWVMMPRDKFLLGAQAVLVGYVLYQVTTSVYNHLKAKDRLKLIKLLYKDNVD